MNKHKFNFGNLTMLIFGAVLSLCPISLLHGATNKIILPAGTDQFTVALSDNNELVVQNLFVQGYIVDTDNFIKVLGKKIVNPGAYKISKNMNPIQLVKVLTGKPYMVWVLIPPGLRKEEIAILVGNKIGWTNKQKKEFINKSTTSKIEYIEGVYMPDTYLIPVGEKPNDIANRLISKWNENFASHLPKFTAKNIKWTSALTLASIVQREAANKEDMPLIAGILWNRLNQNIALGVDATLQYIRGDKGNGFWAPISAADKKNNSLYNTYKYKGLPPHPISNPGIDAIDAVLNPMQTNCVYYLHDKSRVTHCAATYEEHKTNIELFLKNSSN
jgi:UPF0755 protein